MLLDPVATLQFRAAWDGDNVVGWQFVYLLALLALVT